MLVSVQKQCWPQMQYQKLQKTILKFLGARIAAMNLFQFDLDKPWNYLWYFHIKKNLRPRCPLMNGRGEYPVMHPLSGATASQNDQAGSVVV